MPRLNIEKKLFPAKKVWKSFKSSIQKKLHKLKKSKAIKKTAKHLNTVLRRKSNKTLRRPSSHLRIHRKTHQYRPSYAPVYVHELFMQPTVAQITTKVDKKGKLAATIEPGSSSIIISTEFRKEGKMITDNVLACSSTSGSQSRYCVDQRAEEFINKFKEELRQQEMLARTS